MEEEKQTRKGKYAADFSSFREAEARIRPFIHKTPLLSSESLDALSGRHLFFKCELFQKGGAFKFRGACNAVFSLSDDQASKGVVTHSSGNHAAALSLAAKLRGIPAYIVVPKNAPKCKVENVKRYGGQIIWSEPNMQSRESTAAKVLQDTGAVLLHPYNDGRIISGQGTISLELLEQAPKIDTIIAPISGLPVVRDFVDDVITVEDNEIIEAMKLCYEILKVAVEPSGAIGLAAVLSDSFKENPAWKDCSHIGIILSGGNVDLGVLWHSFKR
ncbi:Serine racemase [Morus notabilis]|uniref:Serine racemase n=1 Tax=Morus notabilis TaxID=981085 RepID=W9R3B5_9ROSA|nr:Serine racemase [Morus notabilis]